MTHDADVVRPSRLAGPSLTAAGLAAWVFASSSREDEARRCGELQEVINAALTREEHAVLVARPVLEEAAHLWERAAEILDGQAAASDDPRPSSENARQAERLRLRARSLRSLLP